MAQFIIYSSETVLYQTRIEAESEDEALAMFSIDEVRDEVDRTGFSTDDIQEIS